MLPFVAIKPDAESPDEIVKYWSCTPTGNSVEDINLGQDYAEKLLSLLRNPVHPVEGPSLLAAVVGAIIKHADYNRERNVINGMFTHLGQYIWKGTAFQVALDERPFDARLLDACGSFGQVLKSCEMSKLSGALSKGFDAKNILITSRNGLARRIAQTRPTSREGLEAKVAAARLAAAVEPMADDDDLSALNVLIGCANQDKIGLGSLFQDDAGG